MTVGGQSCLDLYGSYINILHLEAKTYTYLGWTYYGRFDTERGTTDITFDHIHAGAIATGSQNLTITHNDLGPSMDPFNNRCCGGNNVTWSDNFIHDMHRLSDGHIECLTWDGGMNISFLRNLWQSCDTFGLFAKPVENVSGVIDHNAFWSPDGVFSTQDIAVRTGSGANQCNVTVKNTWISQGLDLSCPGAVDGGGNSFHAPTVQPPDPRQ